MNANDAVAWVNRNKDAILAKVQRYTTYAPYSGTDYLQDAYEAAIMSARICEKDPTQNFGAVFRNCHRKIIFKVTPYTDEAHKQAKESKLPPVENITAEECTSDPAKKIYNSGYSTSFPINMRRDVSPELIHDRKISRRPEIDMDEVYKTYVAPNLSEKEQQALKLAIGLTENGYCTPNEIGLLMGVKGGTVRKMIERAITKTKNNVISINTARAKKAAEDMAAVAGEQGVNDSGGEVLSGV